MRITRGFSAMALMALIMEVNEFGSLDDTAENMETDDSKLSPDAVYIKGELILNGIKYADDVTKFSEENLEPLLYTNKDRGPHYNDWPDQAYGLTPPEDDGQYI